MTEVFYKAKLMSTFFNYTQLDSWLKANTSKIQLKTLIQNKIVLGQ